MVVVPSTLDAVTVYAEGALCTRLVSVVPAEGRLPTRLRINGLPLALRTGSLRASVLQGPSGLAVRDIRPVFDVQLPPEPDIPAEQQALEKAQQALALVTEELTRVQTFIHATQQLRPAFPPQSKQNPQPRDAALPGVLALSAFVDADLAALHARRLELERQQRDAAAEVELRQRRLQESSSALRVQRAQLFRAAILTLSEVEATGETGARLALEYAVDGARWVPGYDLRLPRTLDGGTLTMRASIFQRTGEDWKNVKLSLSTADIDRRAEVPELKALRIGRRQPAPARSGWREPPPGLDELFSGFDAAGGTRRRQEPLPQGAPASGGEARPKGGVEKDAREYTKVGGRPQHQELASAPAPQKVMPPPAPVMPMAAAPSMAAPASRGGGGFAPGGPPPEMEEMDEAPPRMMSPKKKSANLLRRREAAPRVLADEAPADDASGADAEGGAAPQEPPEPELQPASDLLDYGALELGTADHLEKRGRLQPRPQGASEELFALAAVSVHIDVVALVARSQQEARRVQHVVLPQWAVPPRQSTPHFDSRYDVERRADVPSDTQWHLVPVFAAPVGLSPEYVCVPSMEPRAFRTVKVENRTPHALLAGPVDVTLGEEFLMTSPLPTLPPGATQRLGLGVEESIKVSRNTRFDEAAGGVFGGAAVLTHHISIEVANRLGQRVTVEVRERVPVPDASEKDIKVEESEVKPGWSKPVPLPGETPVEGERAWRVVLQAGEKQTLGATYVVRIPSSKMLQGGNRRT
jgi:hypothetical protein